MAQAHTVPLLREALGASLREVRQDQHLTLREVSSRARISLGYLSEIERGHKEPSSELLASVCAALDVEQHELVYRASERLRPQATLRLAA